jgi:hypothetical protein
MVFAELVGSTDGIGYEMNNATIKGGRPPSHSSRRQDVDVELVAVRGRARWLLASVSPVQDPGLLLLKLGLGQDAGLLQLAELRQLGEPIAGVGGVRRCGGCLRRCDSCRGCCGLVLRRPSGLLPALDPPVD